MRFLGDRSEVLQISLAAKPHRAADQKSFVSVRHPGLTKFPSRLLANAAKNNFQRGREIAGRGHLHRDRLQQTELLFARWVSALSLFDRLFVDSISIAHFIGCIARAPRTALRN